MIPREILKKIRQIEIRKNRVVTGFAAHGCVRIPTGFRPKAQGCAPGATLGHLPANIINRNAVAAIPSSSVARDVCHNPVGVGDDLIPFTQGSSFLATLGWRTQSLWDCPNRPANAGTELQTSLATRCRTRITHYASRHP
jgi:hypothetical protein